MNFEFMSVSNGCNVYELNFKYAIKYNSMPSNWADLIKNLEPRFGLPATRNLYFRSYNGLAPRRATEDLRWFVGPKHWGASKNPRTLRRTEHWMVFRNEKDRLLASLMI